MEHLPIFICHFQKFWKRKICVESINIWIFEIQSINIFFMWLVTFLCSWQHRKNVILKVRRHLKPWLIYYLLLLFRSTDTLTFAQYRFYLQREVFASLPDKVNHSLDLQLIDQLIDQTLYLKYVANDDPNIIEYTGLSRKNETSETAFPLYYKLVLLFAKSLNKPLEYLIRQKT